MKLRHIFILLCPVLVSLLIWYSFFPSLKNDFTMDDHVLILGNKDVNIDPKRKGKQRSLIDFSEKLWTNDIWGKDIREKDSHRSYRPLLVKFFQILTQYTKGQPDAYFIRVVSTVMHTIASVLVFFLSVYICDDYLVSTAAATLFATHPIHVEAVVAVCNMAESLSVIFTILSYLLFIFVSESNYSVAIQVFSMLIWFMLVLLSILFKETGLIACVMVFSFTLMHSIRDVAQLIGSYLFKKKYAVDGKGLLSIYLWNLISVFTCYLYFSFRSLLISPYFDSKPPLSDFLTRLVMQPIWDSSTTHIALTGSYISNESQLIRRTENPFALLEGGEKYLSTLYLHFRYFYQLAYPIEQSPEYAYDCIPKISDIYDIRNDYWFSLYLSIIFLGFLGFLQITCCWVWRGGGGEREKEVKATAKEMIEKDVNVNEKEVKEVKQKSKSKNEKGVKDQEKDKNEKDVKEEDVKDKVVKEGDEQQKGVKEVVEVKEKEVKEVEEVKEKVRVKEQDEEVKEKGTTTRGKEFKSKLTKVKEEPPSLQVLSESSLLHASIWMLVPFLPATGFIFKLGTLLAERLLYGASIGYCILLALLLYWTLFWLLRIVMFGPLRMLESSVRNLCFCGMIGVVVYLYSERTRSYGPWWKDNEELFMKSIAVCPRSSKLNLSVAKVYISRNDLPTAAEYLEVAREIDPDYCDIDFEEGRVKFFHGDLSGAIDLIIKNLKCVYTADKALEFLHQLLDMQIKKVSDQGDQRKVNSILLKQAKKLMTHPLPLMAAFRYIVVASNKFQVNKFKTAVKLSVKAEKTMDSIFDKRDLNKNNFPKDLVCLVYGTSGVLRVSLMNDPKMVSKFQSEINRSYDLLLQAVQPICIEGHLQYFKTSMHYLAELSAMRFDAGDPQFLSSFASFLSIGSSSLLSLKKVEKKEQTIPGFSQSIAKLLSEQKLRDMQASEDLSQLSVGLRKNACRVWNLAGNKFFEQKKFKEALKSFEEALICHCPSASSFLPINTITRLVSLVKTREFSSFILTSSLLYPVSSLHLIPPLLENVELNAVSCHSLYWYAISYNSIDEGLDDFSKDTLVAILNTYLMCDEKIIKKQKYLPQVQSLMKEYGEVIEEDTLDMMDGSDHVEL